MNLYYRRFNSIGSWIRGQLCTQKKWQQLPSGQATYPPVRFKAWHDRYAHPVFLPPGGGCGGDRSEWIGFLCRGWGLGNHPFFFGGSDGISYGDLQIQKEPLWFTHPKPSSPMILIVVMMKIAIRWKFGGRSTNGMTQRLGAERDHCWGTFWARQNPS